MSKTAAASCLPPAPRSGGAHDGARHGSNACARTRRWARRRTRRRSASSTPTHPALRGVDELRAANFYRSVDVEPAADDRVLIRLDDGTPLLLERALGAGRVLLFTSSLDREWNDLPVQPVFVPFMAGIANHLLGGAGFTSEAELGSTLAVRALGLAGGQIFDPRGEAALGLGAGSDDVLLDQVGFYEVVGGGTTELVAVNFDPRESDLTPIDAATLERWQGLGVRPGESADAARPSPRADATVPSSLGPWLVIVRCCCS